MADVTADAGAFGERYHFLARRLHSLSGIIPVGVFLCVHLSVNASIMAGPGAFQYAVDQIHKLNNLGILKAVEVLFILIPIAFHAVVGVIIWLTSMPNLVQYQYAGNLRYTFQRWTGVIAFLFILVHLWHVHWIIPGGAEFDPHAVAESTIAAMNTWWTAPVYAIGVLCAVFHFANGIWSFLIVWGITIGPRSQTISACVCAIIGIVLGLFGFGALIRLKTMDASMMVPPATMESHTTSLGDDTVLHS
ncbi:MAG: succinate dehydrogenase [Phycisphaerae bacterium]